MTFTPQPLSTNAPVSAMVTKWAGERARLPLSEAENARADRFATETLRDQWSWMRAELRLWLSPQVHEAPEAIRIAEEPLGKPILPDFPRFHFNLSHSGPWLAMAASEQGPLGVDIELPKEDFPIFEVAGDFFKKNELQELIALSNPIAQRRLFYEIWTAKEAALKAVGCGLQQNPDQIPLTFDHEHKVTGYSPPLSWRYTGGWHGEIAWAVAFAAE
jgi:4'-phosphopantetheinyl transferase